MDFTLTGIMSKPHEENSSLDAELDDLVEKWDRAEAEKFRESLNATPTYINMENYGYGVGYCIDWDICDDPWTTSTWENKVWRHPGTQDYVNFLPNVIPTTTTTPRNQKNRKSRSKVNKFNL